MARVVIELPEFGSPMGARSVEAMKTLVVEEFDPDVNSPVFSTATVIDFESTRCSLSVVT